MKTIFSNSELPHIWYHANQSDGRNHSKTFYFDGDTIYSYGSHFPIARKLDNCVLITTEWYSRTTQRHVSTVYSAIPGGVDVFEVPVVSADSTRCHECNVESYRERVEELVRKANRARKHKHMHLTAIKTLSDQAAKYCLQFKVKSTLLDVADLNIEEIEQVAAEYLEKQKHDRREKQKQLRVKEKQKIKEWLAGKGDTLHAIDKVYLRVVDEYVQTSHGAVFPVVDAVKAYNLITSIMDSDMPSYLPIATKLGIYDIDKIYRNGTVIAGCHTVEFDQIKTIAAQLIRKESAA